MIKKLLDKLQVIQINSLKQRGYIVKKLANGNIEAMKGYQPQQKKDEFFHLPPKGQSTVWSEYHELKTQEAAKLKNENEELKSKIKSIEQIQEKLLRIAINSCHGETLEKLECFGGFCYQCIIKRILNEEI